MIESLDIKNIGGIKEASLTFDGAFIVITGESGAGKSSLVRALEFISGRRAQLGHIHTLSDSCEVEAVLASEPIDGLPDKLQPQEQTLIAHRSFTRSGRGKASLQQQTVPLTTLAAAMEKNIVIQSQFAQLNLLDPAKQLELVDSCGGETLKKTAEELESAFTSAIAAEKKIVNLKKRRAESERRFDKAPEIIRQIKLLELKPESEEEWERELRDFDTAEIKRRTLRLTAEKLRNGEGGIIDKLEKITRDLREFDEKDDTRLSDAAEKSLCAVQELSALLSESARKYSGVENIEEAKEEIEKKLGLLRKIKRTLNLTAAAAVFDYSVEAERELAWLKDSRAELESLEKEASALRRETARLAGELRALRKASARELAEKVNEHLSGLAMEYAKFDIEIEPLDRVRANGAENVVFTLALPDQSPLPVGKNASGGELSRILIALQLSSSDEKLPGTLVFDEVEAGLGGKTALLAGYKLKALAKRCRTILITHQASIAAMADRHFLVKRDGDDTEIKEICDEEREREIARMLSGDEKSFEALEHARALLSENK